METAIILLLIGFGAGLRKGMAVTLRGGLAPRLR
ncbi:hypothetical protein GGC47_005344 [Bosea sp. OAE752]